LVNLPMKSLAGVSYREDTPNLKKGRGGSLSQGKMAEFGKGAPLTPQCWAPSQMLGRKAEKKSWLVLLLRVRSSRFKPIGSMRTAAGALVESPATQTREQSTRWLILKAGLRKMAEEKRNGLPPESCDGIIEPWVPPGEAIGACQWNGAAAA